MRFLIVVLVLFCSSRASAAVMLGAELQQKNDEVVIETLEPLGALAATGIRPGDILVAINGLPIRYITQVETLLSKIEEKHDIALIVEREGFVFPLNLTQSVTNGGFAKRNIVATADEAVNCALSPNLKCAAKLSLNLRYKQTRHQMLHYVSVIRFLVSAGKKSIADKYLTRMLATFMTLSSQKNSVLHVKKMIDGMVLLERPLNEEIILHILMLLEGSAHSMRDLLLVAEHLAMNGYEKEAVLFSEEGLAKFLAMSEKEQLARAYYLKKVGVVWGRAKDVVAIDNFVAKHEKLLLVAGRYFYEGMLRAASMENDLQLFAKGMNDAMGIAMKSTADNTAKMASMIVQYSWYAGNFKGVDYVTQWMEKFIKRYNKSAHIVQMTYSLAEIYAITGQLDKAMEVLETHLVGDFKNLRFQGMVKVALKAKISRGKGVLMLSQSSQYAELLDKILHYVNAMQRQKITRVKYLSAADIDAFYGLYAALNGDAFRVTAYKDMAFTERTYQKITEGLLEVGKLERALDWAVRYRDRHKTAKAVRNLAMVYRSFGAFAGTKLDNILLRSKYTAKNANGFRDARFERYFWAGQFDKSAELVRVMGNAKRKILEQGVFVKDSCGICRY